jgi:hypothetical protein
VGSGQFYIPRKVKMFRIGDDWWVKGFLFPFLINQFSWETLNPRHLNESIWFWYEKVPASNRQSSFDTII